MNPDTSGVKTASTGVDRTYYGQPVVRAPHWRWLVICYFFFGALAGASFSIATIADLFGRDGRTSRAARYLALAALIPAPILLILDLGRPDRFLNMFRIVKLKSPMSLGSWALLLLGAVSAVSAGLQLVQDQTRSEGFSVWLRWLGILGLPVSLFISGYTGLLLAITNVPIWAKNRLLMGPTFMASAFSSAFAALSLILSYEEVLSSQLPAQREVARLLRRRTVGRSSYLHGGTHARPEWARAQESITRAETMTLASELALLTAGILRLGRLGRPLTRGKLGAIFWPVTYLSGILIPLALHTVALVGRRRLSARIRLLNALQVLAGSFALRMLMIFAGRESANRPEDYFDLTKGHP